jgi:hypothetical protein
MNNRNINGPRTLPCGTPEQTGAVCEDCPSTSTRWLRELRKSRIHKRVGTTFASFHSGGIVPWFIEAWKSVVSIGAMIGASSLRNCVGMRSGPACCLVKQKCKYTVFCDLYWSHCRVRAWSFIWYCALILISVENRWELFVQNICFCLTVWVSFSIWVFQGLCMSNVGNLW